VVARREIWASLTCWRWSVIGGGGVYIGCCAGGGDYVCVLMKVL